MIKRKIWEKVDEHYSGGFHDAQSGSVRRKKRIQIPAASDAGASTDRDQYRDTCGTGDRGRHRTAHLNQTCTVTGENENKELTMTRQSNT